MPQADLTRPFGYADQHDVHDADAAHDQAYPCHPGQQAPEGGRGRFLGLDDVLLGRDRKGVRSQADAVAFGQQDLNLQDHVVHGRFWIHLHKNHPDRVALDPGKWGNGEFLQHQ